jgi:hypothetical protein
LDARNFPDRALGMAIGRTLPRCRFANRCGRDRHKLAAAARRRYLRSHSQEIRRSPRRPQLTKSRFAATILDVSVWLPAQPSRIAAALRLGPRGRGCPPPQMRQEYWNRRAWYWRREAGRTTAPTPVLYRELSHRSRDGVSAATAEARMVEYETNYRLDGSDWHSTSVSVGGSDFRC